MEENVNKDELLKFETFEMWKIMEFYIKKLQ